MAVMAMNFPQLQSPMGPQAQQPEFGKWGGRLCCSHFHSIPPIGHYQNVKLKLKPTTMSLIDIAGSYTSHRVVVGNFGCTSDYPRKIF